MEVIKSKKLQIFSIIVFSVCFICAIKIPFANGKVRDKTIYKKRYSQRLEEIKNKKVDLRKELLRGASFAYKGNIQEKRSKDFFKNKKLRVIIEQRLGRKIVVNALREIGPIKITENALIMNENEREIELEDMRIPCEAYISLGRGYALDGGLFIPMVQYLKPADRRRNMAQ